MWCLDIGANVSLFLRTKDWCKHGDCKLTPEQVGGGGWGVVVRTHDRTTTSAASPPPSSSPDQMRQRLPQIITLPTLLTAITLALYLPLALSPQLLDGLGSSFGSKTVSPMPPSTARLVGFPLRHINLNLDRE